MRQSLFFVIAFLFIFAGLTFAAEDFKVKKAVDYSQSPDYVEGEIVVKFKSDTDNQTRVRTNIQLGATELSTSRYSRVTRLSVPAGRTVEEMVELYSDDPNVEYAEPNYIAHAFMTPNDTYYSYQWHMPMINTEAAWDVTTGSGVIVAVIDGGVAYEDYGSYAQAPDLAGTNFVAGYDFVNNDTHPNDDNAHGTHVAGTIAQTTNNNLGVTGIAFDCSIMPVKALDASGSGSYTDIADAIYWAADNGAHVINMSLGGTYNSSTLEDACDYAYNAGVVICVAAGNAGSSAAQYPAAYSSTISVSAVTLDSTYTSYTSYGSNTDVCAPGGDLDYDLDGDGYSDGVLQQTHDGSDYTSFSYYFYEGTSMACPHVAGTAALILAKAGGGYSLSPDSVKAILQNTAVDLGSSGWDQYYGSGLIDAAAAVNAVGQVENPPVSEFSASTTSGCVSLTVNFTDASTNDPTSWSWTFGDGGTSTSQNPSHTYTAAGTYTVALTATNAYGSDTETKTGYITVNEGPTAYFTGTPTSGEIPLTVTFTDGSTGATSWSWDFGDGGTSTAQSPSYTYNSAGTYTVALTATNSCGSDSYTRTDYITVTCTAPTASFVGSPTSGDYPLTVSFTDQSSNATSWSWDFGDGGTSTAQNPSHEYTAAGTYTVTQTVSNSCGSDQMVRTDYITVTTPTCDPPVADFSGSPTSGDYPLTVTFTDLSTYSPTSWSWDFGDGGTSTTQNPSHTYTSEGTYTVTLTATNSCGSDDEVKTGYITVTEPTVAYAVLPYSTGFETGAFDEYWFTQSDNSEGRIQITTANTPRGTYHLTMDDNYNGGSYAQNEAWLRLNLFGKSDIDLVFYWKEFSDETHDLDGVYFSDDGGTSFSKVYDLTGGSSSYQEITLDLDQLASSAGVSLTSTFVVKFQQYDNYGISYDGMAFDDISVTSNDVPPVADFSGDPTSGSYPLDVDFTDLSEYNPTSWSWNFGDGGTSTAQNPTHTYSAAGTYTVTLTATNAYGSDTETKTDYITVNEPSAWTVITYDDFESGFGNYTDGGGDCYWYTYGTYAYQGSCAADIQDNSGTASSFYHTSGYNVSGYSELEVDFYFIAVSMDRTGEDFWVQYYDGSAWNTVAVFDKGVDFENDIFYHAVVTISSSQYNFPSDAKLRFMCDASGNRDDVYIDEITWSGGSAGASSLREISCVTALNNAEGLIVPDDYSLSQNYPNPFNPSTAISFSLPVPASVSLEVFNVLGQRVAVLADGRYDAGKHVITWDASGQSSGMYFYRLQTDKFVETKKMLLLK